MDHRYAKVIAASASAPAHARAAINAIPYAAWADPKRYAALIGPALDAAAGANADLDAAIADAKGVLDSE